MKEERALTDKDMIVMKLLHYFITEKGYNPIILHGVPNEIWLENMEGPYKIVRIMTGYIHNDSQYDFDMFKTKRIIKKIKLKTLTLKLKALSIFIDLGEAVKVIDSDDIECINVNSEEDILNSKYIKKVFPDIDKKLVVNDNSAELFSKITNDLNKQNQKQAKEAEEIFKSKKPILTYALIAINIFIFILMYLLGNGSYDIETLINFGALSKMNIVLYGEYYRLITSAFIHIGMLHLLFNMYALYIVGTQVEGFFGKRKFLLIYFVSILFSSLISYIFLSTSTVSAGASGAIFGLFGALLFFGYHYRAYLGNVILKQILPVILINLLIGFSISGIDNAAHIGGLFGGLLISYAVGIKHKNTKLERINGIVVTILAVAFLVYYAFLR
jgi:rhomboid protease GluP